MMNNSCSEQQLDIRYVAGLIDADGSLCITVSSRGPNSFGVYWIINFRQIHEDIVRAVHTKMGLGRVYSTDKGIGMRMWSWQTTTYADALAVAKRLYPHLHIKKKICAVFMETLSEWVDTAQPVGGKRLKGASTRPRALVEKVLDASISINACSQTETARRNKAERIGALKRKVISFYGETG